MKNTVLLFLLMGWCSGAIAQYEPPNSKRQFYGNQRIHKPMYRWVTGDYAKHGIQLSFGPTYTFTKMGESQSEIRLSPDSLMQSSTEAKGRLGFFAEIGMVHITRKPRKIIHYYDWGVGYKQFAGAEHTNTSVYDSRDSLVGQIDGKGEFYNGYLYGRFTAHNVFQLNENLFIDNGLGFNVDYALVEQNKPYDGFHPTPQKFQGVAMVQLHYELGLGIRPRADKGFYIVPGIRLPFLGAYEWSGGTPAIHWFSSGYAPAMLKVKFVWLFKKDPNRCPPVETNEMDKQRAKEYKNR